MRALLTTVLVLILATGFLPAGVEAGGAVGTMAPSFQVDNLLDSAPDVISLQEYRGSVVVLAFFGYW